MLGGRHTGYAFWFCLVALLESCSLTKSMDDVESKKMINLDYPMAVCCEVSEVVYFCNM